jgi:hypothetical protein
MACLDQTAVDDVNAFIQTFPVLMKVFPLNDQWANGFGFTPARTSAASAASTLRMSARTTTWSFPGKDKANDAPATTRIPRPGSTSRHERASTTTDLLERAVGLGLPVGATDPSRS